MGIQVSCPGIYTFDDSKKPTRHDGGIVAASAREDRSSHMAARAVIGGAKHSWGISILNSAKG